MNSKFNKITFLIVVFFIIFCQPVFSKTLPKPAESKMLFVKGAGFNVEAGHPEGTTYQLMLNVKDSGTPPFFIEAEYENPSDIKNPFIETQAVSGGQETIQLTSKNFDFNSLKEGKFYTVKINVYTDQSKSNLMDVLTQKVCAVNLRQLGQVVNKHRYGL